MAKLWVLDVELIRLGPKDAIPEQKPNSQALTRISSDDYLVYDEGLATQTKAIGSTTPVG